MRLIFLFLLLILNISIKAQITKFNTTIYPFLFVTDYITYDKLKDSTAFYTFVLKIDVKKQNNQQQVNYKINNPKIAEVCMRLDTLKKIDYSKYLKKGKAKILISYYVTILSSDYKPKLIDIYKIPDVMKYLFDDENEPYIRIGPYHVMIDKKVYN